MDKKLRTLWIVGWIYLSIHHHLIFGDGQNIQFLTLLAIEVLNMYWLQLIHVSKREPVQSIGNQFSLSRNPD